MDPLAHLAVIWGAVFAAVVLAKMTRLTPVLYFLFVRQCTGKYRRSAG